jgi:diguanylate cyclase (GGDEF)-like protein/PAS domain S-box-containing protein
MKAAIESAAINVAMQDDCVPADEAERLACVQRLGLLDTPPAEPFDAVTRLAAAALRVPMLLVSLVDAQRVWFKSRIGLPLRETARPGSFCSHAVWQRQPLIVRDAAKDPRFATSALVIGAPRVRSYLGIPLYTRDRQPVGTLCALDVQARDFGEIEVVVLTEFAKIVEELISAKELAARADGVLQYAMEREKLYRETFEQAAVGIVHTSLSGAILRVNQRACALLGYGAAQLRELSFLDLTHPEDAPNNVREFKRTLAGEIDSYHLEQRLLCKDQRYLWTSLAVALKRGASRQPDYGIAVIEDITAHKQAQEELRAARDALQEKVTLQTRELQASNNALQLQVKQSLASAQALREAQSALAGANAKLVAEGAADALTGLANRRAFSRRGEQAANALRQSRKAYGLILLNVDGFKRINEEYSHEVGDEVLKSLGSMLATQLRNSSDMAARIGGDEFAVLCFGDINEQSLHDVAARIHQQIGKEPLAAAKGLLHFTASFGLALSQLDDADFKTVYGRADAALYEAKAAGKDRISFGRSPQKGATARLKALSLPPPG